MKPTPADVLEVAAVRWRTTPEALLRPGKTQPRCQQRQKVMLGIRRACGLSYPAIGEVFRMDHSTVMHACQRHVDDPEVGEIVEAATQLAARRPRHPAALTSAFELRQMAEAFDDVARALRRAARLCAIAGVGDSVEATTRAAPDSAEVHG